jgi:methionyl-tRNA formyltransferase
VVTQPDRPKGRGRKPAASPVKEAAEAHGLAIFQPEDASSEAFAGTLRSLAPELIVVVAFGHILKRRILEIPPRGVINVHASLLPAYRGAAPIAWAILKGEARTGLTAMQMEERLDSGPILLQEAVEIGPEETAGRLHDRLSRLSGPFLIRTVEGLMKGSLKPVAQDHTQATYAPKIDRARASVRWSDSSKQISALIRAMDPWPGAYTHFEGQDIKLFLPRAIEPGERPGIPGRVIGLSGGLLCIECGLGAVGIGELQIPGKRRIPAESFLRGFPLRAGSLLGAHGEATNEQEPAGPWPPI